MYEKLPPSRPPAIVVETLSRRPRVGSNGSFLLSYRYPGAIADFFPM
jgi:hypothetical protein